MADFKYEYVCLDLLTLGPKCMPKMNALVKKEEFEYEPKSRFYM